MFSPRSFGQLLLAGQIKRTGSYDIHSDSNNNTNWLSDADSQKACSSTSLDLHDDAHRRYDFTKQATKLIAVLKRRSDSYQLADTRSQFTSANLQPPPSPSNNSIGSMNNRNVKDGVTLCTLGVGTTFGASAAPGKTHSVSVVTSDECTLLRVRRADFQEIFNEQSHLIGDLESSPFCSSTSLLASRHARAISQHGTSLDVGVEEARDQPASQGSSVCSSTAGSANRTRNLAVDSSGAGGLARRCATPNNGPVGCEPDDQEEPVELGELAQLSLSSASGDKRRASGEQLELPSQLMRIGWLLRTLIVHQAPLMIQNRRLVRQPAARLSQVGALASTATTAPVNRKQLVSTGSSSQLLAGRSAASQAGRRVAGYVVSSLMRSRNQHQQSVQPNFQQHQQPTMHSHQVTSSNSFDLNPAGQGEPIGSVQLVRRSMLGRDMVDWLMNLGGQPNSTGSAGRYVNSRLQAISMWQVLLEQGVVLNALQASTVSGAQSCRAQFCDDSLSCYQFWCDRSDQPDASLPLQRPNDLELAKANESLWWALKVLAKLAPDACFRLILSKQPHERSLEEVDIVFEELQHLKALSHLGNGVKKQLAACVTSEHHPKQNTVIFNQGDTGQSWYIILRGSVNVVIVGKGVVCTLHDGDDFGKLALVNDAPRAATIVTNEPNCYFLRVDKLDFNTILRDVEANTVRLREHGKEVLILQRVPIGREQPATNQVGPTAQVQSGALAPDGGAAGSCATALEPHQNNSSANAETSGAQATASVQQQQQPTSGVGASTSALKYMVMAGTGEKMLEHLLETRIDGQTQIGPLITCKSGLMQHDQVSAHIQSGNGDNFLEDFILTHKIFMTTGNLCHELFKHYQCQPKQLQSQTTLKEHQSHQQHSQLDDDYLVAKKRRVVKFVRCWMLISREQFFHQHQIQSFLTDLHQKVKQDAQRFPSLQPELKAISRILELHLEEELGSRHRGIQRWICDIYGNMLPLRRLLAGAWQPEDADPSETYLRTLHQRRLELKPSTIEAQDEVIFRVYCTDHTFATVRARLDDEAAQIKQVAAKHLHLLDKELILVHVKSNGERIIFNDLDANLVTSLSVNGRIFVCPLDHIDAISPLPEQDPFQEVYRTLAVSSTGSSTTSADVVPVATSANSSSSSANSLQAGTGGWQTSSIGAASISSSQPSIGSEPVSSHQLTSTPSSYADIRAQMNLSCSKLEEFSSRDIAYCLTQLAWSLLKNMHEFELIYILFGRQNFQNHKQITANLNVFLRHFNEIQYWVVTQICLSNSLSKRVQIMRKFVKIAAYCKELQNLNAFFAIIMGLSNMAVARLTQTWEKLPGKLKRTFSQFESLIDPSRNHRRYRIFMSKMEPPIIPFMPLLLKDMTFAHEGNKTYLESGLINFEKMQMVAQTLRTIRYCKSRPLKLDSSACKYKGSIRSIELFFRDLKIIDNQRTLTQMSHHLELRKT